MNLDRKLGSTLIVLWVGLVLISIFGAWQSRESMQARTRRVPLDPP